MTNWFDANLSEPMQNYHQNIIKTSAPKSIFYFISSILRSSTLQYWLENALPMFRQWHWLQSHLAHIESLGQCFSTFFSTWNPLSPKFFCGTPYAISFCWRNPKDKKAALNQVKCQIRQLMSRLTASY